MAALSSLKQRFLPFPSRASFAGMRGSFLRSRHIRMSRVSLYLLAVALLFVPIRGICDMQLSGLQDFDFGDWTSGGLDRDYPLCVYNSAATTYSITASLQAPLGYPDFTLDDNGSHPITFQVFWSDTTTKSEVAMTMDIAQDGDHANTSSPTCSGVNNANLRVKVASSVLNTAYAGTYSATLLLTLGPHS